MISETINSDWNQYRINWSVKKWLLASVQIKQLTSDSETKRLTILIKFNSKIAVSKHLA